jgi:hypothetical protein
MSKARSGLASDRRIYACHYTPAISSTSETSIAVVSGKGSLYNGTMTQVSIPGSLFESSYDLQRTDVLDEGEVPIPMSNIVFNFFGTNHSNNLYWSSNNALIITTQYPLADNDGIYIPIVNISRNTVPSILLGNYDRLLKTFFHTSILTTNYSIKVLIVTFYDYFNATIASSTYQYQIRLIKENIGSQRQFVEVYVVSSPPSPGYSTGTGTNTDTYGEPIDSTKLSPYNITNGTNFLNPCGTTFSTVSPSSNTSFVFSSDSTGTSWVFTNNAYVNV